MDKDMKVKIGKRIEAIRKERGLTKDAFAKDLGITAQYLGLVERGQNALAYDKLERLCKLTGLPADYILFGNEVQLEEKVKKLLTGYTNTELQNACETIKQIALYLKN